MTENEAIKRIEDYIKECNYTWTVDAIFAEYVKLQNHCYVSYTARDVIDNCVTALKVLQAKALEELQMYKDGKLCLIPKDVYTRQCDELDAYKEKDIPYKPEFLHMLGETKAKFSCKCGNVFSHECPGFPDESMQYCDRCGQKLEWRDDNDAE